jgi:hypothetical protein
MTTMIVDGSNFADAIRWSYAMLSICLARGYSVLWSAIRISPDLFVLKMSKFRKSDASGFRRVK